MPVEFNSALEFSFSIKLVNDFKSDLFERVGQADENISFDKKAILKSVGIILAIAISFFIILLAIIIAVSKPGVTSASGERFDTENTSDTSDMKYIGETGELVNGISLKVVGIGKYEVIDSGIYARIEVKNNSTETIWFSPMHLNVMLNGEEEGVALLQDTKILMGDIAPGETKQGAYYFSQNAEQSDVIWLVLNGHLFATHDADVKNREIDYELDNDSVVFVIKDDTHDLAITEPTLYKYNSIGTLDETPADKTPLEETALDIDPRVQEVLDKCSNGKGARLGLYEPSDSYELDKRALSGQYHSEFDGNVIYMTINSYTDKAEYEDGEIWGNYEMTVNTANGESEYYRGEFIQVDNNVSIDWQDDIQNVEDYIFYVFDTSTNNDGYLIFVYGEKEYKSCFQRNIRENGYMDNESYTGVFDVFYPFDDTMQYILPESDSRVYDVDEWMPFTDDMDRLALNEIYARHGRRFKDADLQDYFDHKPWYNGTIEPDDFSESILNDYEKQNRDLLSSFR